MAGKGLTEQRLKDMESAFSAFDKNQDGRITKDELNHVFQKSGVKLSNQQLESFMRKVDTDGNGTIDYNEFCTMMKNTVSSTMDMESNMKSQFRKMDEDGDGKISQSELQRAMKKITPDEPLSDKEAREIINTVDKDGDGHINYDEFVTLMYILQFGGKA